jgi:hypothetical protein
MGLNLIVSNWFTFINDCLRMNQPQQTVIIDNCAVDRLAEFGVNPVEDLQNTEFRLMYTPDLKLEYEQALLSSARTSQQARTLIEQILKAGTLIGLFGFDGGPCLGFDRGVWAGQDQSDVIASLNAKAKAPHRPGKRTDAHLIALAQDAIVITANAKEAHWTRSPLCRGQVIQWSSLKNVLQRWPNLAVAIRHLLIAQRLGAVSGGDP